MINLQDALIVEQARREREFEETHEYSPMPDIDTCIKVLIRKQCKVHLAAKAMNVPVEDLALFLGKSPNKERVYEALEAVTIIEALDNLATASQYFKEVLGDPGIQPADVAKAYTHLLATVKSFTSPKQTNGTQVNVYSGDVNQYVLEELDTHERQAVLVLAEEKRKRLALAAGEDIEPVTIEGEVVRS